MASKIQFKRGSTTQSDAYRGAEGEVIINTTKDTIVVHDGVEAGGYEIIRSDLSNISGNVPAVNITDVDCGIYGSGLFAPASLSASLLQTLDNPNAYGTSANDRFSYSAAISGNYVIVGAIYESKAYIFNVTTGALLHTLDNPGTSVNAFFGEAVGITDTYAIVGAFQENDAGGTESGKAYIYNNSTGALLHTLDNPNAYGTSKDDYFGRSVAISGNYAIVGANGEDVSGSNSSGKAYIFDVTTGALVRTLNNPNPSANDYFGYSVAISGNYAIVGSHGEDDAGGNQSGKAYIFDVTTGALLQTLDNPNAYGTSQSDSFGGKVGITDTYAIVVAAAEDDAGGASSGKAYIFDVTTGALLQTLDNPNAYGTSEGDTFGASVGISGNYVIVGAIYEDDAGGASSGKAYIFELEMEAGNEIDAPGAPTIGTATVVDHETVTVAYTAPSDDGYATIETYTATSSPGGITGTLSQAGSGTITVTGLSGSTSYTFTVTATNSYTTGDPSNASSTVTTPATPIATFLRTLDNPNDYGSSLEDSFGQVVGISGNYAIVGAWKEDDAGGTDSGKAYIYNNSTGALLHTLDNPNDYGTSAADNFGSKVAISDTYSIVGAYNEDDAGGLGSGKAYIYNNSTGALLHTLDNPNDYDTSAGDQFGITVAISDTYAIVAAYTEDDADGTSSGKAYIFNNSTGALVHTLDNPNAYGTSANDLFGNSVALTDSYAIVGANNEDDAGGTSSGKAYIFNVSTGALVHTLDNPNDYGSSLEDSFGVSVGISGNYAIVGAHAEDDAGGTTSGKAYIFNVSTGALVHTLDNPNAYSTSANDYFGIRVAISGNYAIVGAHSEDDASGTTSGKAYIFNVSTGALLETLDNPNAYGTSTDDLFGLSVAISDNYAIVGSREDDAGGSNSGKAYMYSL